MIVQNVIHERLFLPGPGPPQQDPSCDSQYSCITSSDNDRIIPLRNIQCGSCELRTEKSAIKTFDNNVFTYHDPNVSINIQKGVLVEPRNALEKGKASIQTTNFYCRPRGSFFDVATRCCVQHRKLMTQGTDNYGCYIFGGLHSFNNKAEQDSKLAKLGTSMKVIHETRRKVILSILRATGTRNINSTKDFAVSI